MILHHYICFYQDTETLEDKKLGVKGIGRKKPDEKEHLTWKDNIKVPCGKLVPSGCKDSPLEYNEYAVYDPKQVRRNRDDISFLH